MDRKAVSFLIAGALLGALIATAGFAVYTRDLRSGGAEQKLLKLGHSLSPEHPVHKGMVRLAKLVEERSGGSLQVEIFPGGQLGSETGMIEQVQRGALAMTKTSSAPLSSFIDEMGVFGVPYVFRSEEHYWQVLTGPIGREILLSGQDKGVRGLCYYDAGARSFYTIDTPVQQPSDLEGLKIRVQKSENAIQMVRALGGSPTPIAWGELYTALQQGTVDGAENNLPSFYSNRHFEVCKHFSLDEHTMVPDILLISTDVWQNLTSQQQRWLQEAAADSRRYQRKLWDEAVDEALRAVKDAGVTIHRPEKAPFIEKVQSMHDAYAGTVVGELMARIEKVQ